MLSEPLIEERHAGIAILTLARPRSANAINVALAEAIEAALTRLSGDPDLRAVVITGQGGSYFCAGGDLKEYRTIDTREELEAIFGRVRNILDKLETMPVPVIAAVEGFALGGGSELVLACDHRIAGQSACFGFPQVRLGILPGWNGVERLVRAGGRWHAIDLLSTGRRLDAVEAQALGLVDRVVGEGEAFDAALAYGETLAEAAPLALAAVKQMVAVVERDGKAARLELADRFAELWFSADHREAEAAFAEKRAPVFKGA